MDSGNNIMISFNLWVSYSQWLLIPDYFIHCAFLSFKDVFFLYFIFNVFILVAIQADDFDFCANIYSSFCHFMIDSYDMVWLITILQITWLNSLSSLSTSKFFRAKCNK